MTADWMLWPLLPVWAWPLTWAVVAAACVVWLWPREARHHPASTAQAQTATGPSRAHRKVKGPAWLMGVMAGGVACLAVWPQGGWSGYAALALQSPSLLTLTWAIVCLWQSTGWTEPAHDPDRVPAPAWVLLCVVGWMLTIDTLNLWPSAWDVRFYAWGFSAGSLWLSVLVVLLMAGVRHGPWVWTSIAVLLLYAGLRWPTGNVWDAWLDPAVWMVAHVQTVKSAWSWIRVGRGH